MGRSSQLRRCGVVTCGVASIWLSVIGWGYVNLALPKLPTKTLIFSCTSDVRCGLVTRDCLLGSSVRYYRPDGTTDRRSRPLVKAPNDSRPIPPRQCPHQPSLISVYRTQLRTLPSRKEGQEKYWAIGGSIRAPAHATRLRPGILVYVSPASANAPAPVWLTRLFFICFSPVLSFYFGLGVELDRRCRTRSHPRSPRTCT